MPSPGYLALYQRGELARRIEATWAMLAPCRLCPHRCGVDRLRGERGVCRMGATVCLDTEGFFRARAEEALLDLE
ncbi:MAG TPA: hypothetical protein ENJ31_00660 [Anaerolineae bacterium]|nr:hypothetical protein [Anaerolineae bacterium]